MENWHKPNTIKKQNKKKIFQMSKPDVLDISQKKLILK